MSEVKEAILTQEEKKTLRTEVINEIMSFTKHQLRNEIDSLIDRVLAEKDEYEKELLMARASICAETFNRRYC